MLPQRTPDEVPAAFTERAVAEMQMTMPDSVAGSGIDMQLITKEYQQEKSILGEIGHLCEPVVKPLGFDWKVSVSLLAGAAAKEVVVSTLGVLYIGNDDADMLAERLKTPSRITGEAPFTPLKAIVFMVFVLIYFPCIATIAAVVKETGSWKYGLFSVIYNTGLAWLLAFIVYRIGLLF